MGNRAEEDYNFVFKGEWGSPKGKPGRDPGRHQPHKGPSWFFFFQSYRDPPPKGSSFGWEGMRGGGGPGFWTGARALSALRWETLVPLTPYQCQVRVLGLFPMEGQIPGDSRLAALGTEVRLQRGLPCREGGERADSRGRKLFFWAVYVRKRRERRGRAVLGPGKDAGKTQPPGTGLAGARGLPGPSRVSVPWQADPLAQALASAWLAWPTSPALGSAPAWPPIVPSPATPAPRLPPDRVGQGGPAKPFPLQPPRPTASPGRRPALTWASQVTSQALGNRHSQPASFPGRELGPALAIVWGSSAEPSRCASHQLVHHHNDPKSYLSF